MHQATPGAEIHIITGEFLKASVWLEYYDFVFLKNKKQKTKTKSNLYMYFHNFIVIGKWDQWRWCVHLKSHQASLGQLLINHFRKVLMQFLWKIFKKKIIKILITFFLFL